MTGRIKADEFNRIFDREVEKYKENLAKDKFVVYPDPQFTMEELIQHKQMSDEKERGVIFTPKVEEEGRIDELPMVDTGEQLTEPNVSSILTPEEIAKFSPAPEENGEGVPTEEPKELTDEEKRVIFIQQLKDSKIKFHPIKHFIVKHTMVVTEELDVLGKKKKRKDSTILTNVTTNQFGADYRKKRKNKNRMARASRKANR